MEGKDKRPSRVLGTTNWQALIRNSPVSRRAAEDGKYTARVVGFKKGTDDEFPGYLRKPMSPERAEKERAMRTWESRRNSCSVCHMAKSVTGECMCNE